MAQVIDNRIEVDDNRSPMEVLISIHNEIYASHFTREDKIKGLMNLYGHDRATAEKLLK